MTSQEKELLVYEFGCESWSNRQSNRQRHDSKGKVNP